MARDDLGERLRHTETLLAHVRDSVTVTDPAGIVTFWNEGSTRLFGWTAAEMVGRPLTDRVPEEGRAAMTATIATIRDGQPFAGEWLDYRKDGSRVWIDARVCAIPGPAGRPQGLIGVARDVTPRKQAEEALRQSEERFRVALGANPTILVFTQDRELRYTWVHNPQLGYAAADVLGRTDADLLPTADAARLTAIKRRVLETGARARQEVRLTHGGDRFFDLTVEPLRDAGGRVAGITCVVVDVTERKQAEAELEARVRERTAELARANADLLTEVRLRRAAEAARTELLRRLATAEEAERRRLSRELHDQLGQQIAFLALSLKALADGGAVPAARLARVRAVVEDVGRAVHDLAWRLRPPALDDLGLLPALHSTVEDWARQAGVEVDFHGRGLDGGRLPGEVETTLFRVVREALHNTLKHARAGHVNVILERRPAEVLLILEDDGVGFDAEAVTANPPPGRLGLLGLRERMELIGGTLEIESTPGAGTTVFAQVPLTGTGVRNPV